MLNLSAKMRQEIACCFDRMMADIPSKRREVEGYLACCTREEALCLQFLYGFLPVADVLSFSPEQLMAYITPALRAREDLPYGKTVPAELFLNYVLMPRVNNEYLDLSREFLQSRLLPRVQGKPMTAAALEVNYWCLEHVTYHPSDDRTLAPLAVMKSTMGRCGEESTFAVSALRSVGIPARQCYVPRWSHCDDNHAWVELWAEGTWHYLGACEPEPVLDKGWFTAAASRAMVVHSRAFSPFAPEAVFCGASTTLIHSTPNYADCVSLQVQVLKQGRPAAGVQVQFGIVNYSEFYPIFTQPTDAAGKAVFVTGKGDLLLQIVCNGKLLTRYVDTRREQTVALDLQNAKTPAEMGGTVATFDLVPPAERPVEDLPAEDPGHQKRLALCDAARLACIQTFRGKAKGNWLELEAFLQDDRFSGEEKQQLLSTLHPKDFLDCTANMLADTLQCARQYRDRFMEEIYRNYILSPRVGEEMLLPVRSAIRSQIGEDFPDGRAILCWLQAHVRLVEDGEYPVLVPNCAEAIRHGCINKSGFGVLFVTLCRTFGIPARRNPHTLACEYFFDGSFVPMEGTAPEKTVAVHLVNAAGIALPYGERFTLGRFRGEGYETLRFDGLLLENEVTLQIPAGEYVLLTTTRQIDGTISVRMAYESICDAMTLLVTVPEDQTPSRIRQVSLTLPEGDIQTSLKTGGRRFLMFLEPGKEPTEHLLQELLECQREYQNYGLLLFAQSNLQNPTLQRVLAALPHAVLKQTEDMARLQALRKAMGVGDARLPFCLALDEQGRGLYACANYNIGTARLLLNIQKLSEKAEERY